jgi:hypothetical protein
MDGVDAIQGSSLRGLYKVVLPIVGTIVLGIGVDNEHRVCLGMVVLR